MKSSRFILLSPVLICTACTTLAKNDHNMRPISHINTPIILVAKQISTQCFSSVSPQFLAEVASSSPFSPSFQIEGVWLSYFSKMQLRILGPLGEEYVNVTLKEQAIKLEDLDNSIISNKEELNSLLSLLSKLGSRGIREILCGAYAFNSLNNNEDLFEEIPPDQHSLQKDKNLNFVSQSHMNIDGHNIAVYSRIYLNPLGEGYNIQIDSKFFYGLFSTESDIHITWFGYTRSKKVLASEVKINLKNKTYRLIFDDYY